MSNLEIIDRSSCQLIVEKVYGKKALDFFYGNSFFSKFFLSILIKFKFFSAFYGFLQKSRFSRKKISAFIQHYEVKVEELEKKPEEYHSFNDFFIRKLKAGCRQIDQRKNVAILPADARYMVFQDLSLTSGFYVKGEKFDLSSFLQNELLAKQYAHGSMVIARLCPVDYHRFHFPFECMASDSRLINGYLYSVNPIALRKNISVFSQNKRVITTLSSKFFGEVLFIEVGAANVGTINQTFIPQKNYKKGEEKGYFSFGGSSIVLLFEKNRILFDEDLLKNSEKKIETKALFGQSLGMFF